MSGAKRSVMVVAGTRPEIIKLSPIIKWFDKHGVDYLFVWSGQHYDYELSRVFFEQLGITEPDINLDIRSGSHAEQTAKMLVSIEKVIGEYNPKVIVAQGDTNTVISASLAAAKTFVPFAHVEAGLRSWDRTMPEEVNRIVADSLAEILFAPTELAAINLMHEGVPLNKIRVTGNTVVDVVVEYKNYISRTSRDLLGNYGLKKDGYILVTVHRQENTDDKRKMHSIIKALLDLSEYYTIVFPMHPRTVRKLEKYNLLNNLMSRDNILVIKPLGYFQFLGLLMNSLIVLTDSGGVQEEACTLKVPTLTLRYNTERPETVMVGINKVIGVEYEDIVKHAMGTIRAKHQLLEKIGEANPFGDGRAGERIARYLVDYVERDSGITSVDTREDPYITYALVEKNELNRELDLSLFSSITALYDGEGMPTTNTTSFQRMLIRGPISELRRIKAGRRSIG